MAPRNRGIDGAPKAVADGCQTVSDLRGNGPFAELAKQHWLNSNKKSTKMKVKQDVLKNDIWDVLAQEDFQYRLLLELENLQILERY